MIFFSVCLDPVEFNEINDIEFPAEDFSSFDLKNCPENTFICIDDYLMHASKSRNEFQSIVNYVLRHKKITLLLVMHQVNLTKHYSELMVCPHIFLTYSPSSAQYVAKTKSLYKEIETGYDYISQMDYSVLYANKIKNYAISIKPGFVPDRMFVNGDDKYIIHLESETCNQESVDIPNKITEMAFLKDLLETYSKHKKKVLILVHMLIKNDFLQDTESLLVGNDNFLHKIHLVDFFSICLSVNKVKLSKKDILFFKSLFSESTYSFPKSIFPLFLRKYMT